MKNMYTAEDRNRICRELGLKDTLAVHKLIVEGVKRGAGSLKIKGLDSRKLKALGYDATGLKKLGYPDSELAILGFYIPKPVEKSPEA